LQRAETEDPKVAEAANALTIKLEAKERNVRSTQSGRSVRRVEVILAEVLLAEVQLRVK
jgi:hypothetical protein